MDLAIRKLHPLFAAEVRGVDLSRDVDPATRDAIEHAVDGYAVCSPSIIVDTQGDTVWRCEF